MNLFKRMTAPRDRRDAQLFAHRVFLQWHTVAIAGLVLWCLALSIALVTGP